MVRDAYRYESTFEIQTGRLAPGTFCSKQVIEMWGDFSSQLFMGRDGLRDLSIGEQLSALFVPATTNSLGHTEDA